MSTTAPGGGGGVVWPGHPDRYDPEDIATLTAAEAASGQSWAYWQGGYSTRVAASMGYHAGGGVVDLVPRDHNWQRAAQALEAHGWTAYIRTGPAWIGNEHIHAVRRGSTTQSAGAAKQASTRGSGALSLSTLAKLGVLLPGIVGNGVVDAIGGAATGAAKSTLGGIDAIGGFFGALAQRNTWIRVLQVVGGAAMVVGGVVIVGRGVIGDVAIQAIPGGQAIKTAAQSVTK